MLKNRGLRHLALRVRDVERSKRFYMEVFGMALVWQPDPENAYLSSGCDNLALHAHPEINALNPSAVLDHFGFIIESTEKLEDGYRWVQQEKVDIVHALKKHRDGSSSFYIRDPDGNVIQLLYEPTISRIVLESEKAARG